MIATICLMVFGGALAASLAVIAVSVGPQWRRIVRLATGHPDPVFMPLATLAGAERRIATRRWVVQSVPAISGWREAA